MINVAHTIVLEILPVKVDSSPCINLSCSHNFPTSLCCQNNFSVVVFCEMASINNMHKELCSYWKGQCPAIHWQVRFSCSQGNLREYFLFNWLKSYQKSFILASALQKLSVKLSADISIQKISGNYVPRFRYFFHLCWLV